MSRIGTREDAAFKLLMKLSREGVRLEPIERDTSGETRYVLAEEGRASSKRSKFVSFEFVKTLHKEDLVAPNKGGFVLSSVGKSWLRRKLSSGDEFRAQHQQRSMETAEIEGMRRPALVDESESPLGWLRRRKDKSGAPMIDIAQFEAGERLRRDFFYAGLSPRVTASWDGIPGDRSARRTGPGASANLREQTVAAQQRVRRALEQLQDNPNRCGFCAAGDSRAV